MVVEAKVILPELSPEFSPLLIKKFETDVVNTVHHVGDLNKKVLFQSLLLKGENAGIDVQVSFISVACFYSTNYFKNYSSQCKRTQDT